MSGQERKTLSQCIIFALFLHSCCGGQDDNYKVMRRDEKLLNVFNIVKFPNDGCTTASGTYGVCYTASECLSLSGSSSGTCASGFGVCCTFTGGCGGTTSINNTYFKSSGSDSSACTFKVCKAGPDVCQLRLNFDTFIASQPSTIQPGDTAASGRTQCQKSQFRVSSDGPASPTLCGTNSGHHIIVEADDDCNEISFTWASGVSQPEWNIQVMQISCSSWWKPQDGCSQWYTGTTGYVKSFNYDEGTHLADQLYTVCVRQEYGYCSIEWASVSTTSFQISGPATTQTGARADSCTTDYLIINGATNTPTSNPRYDRYCGGYFGSAPASVTVKTEKIPFHMTVSFDGSEQDPGPATYEYSKGFYLYYKQGECT